MHKMRSALLALATALVASVFVPDLPWEAKATAEAHYFGIARFGPSGWVILNDANHKSVGLASVECLVPGSGELKITYDTPLVNVGTANVTMDEAYAGRVFAGPSVGLSAAYLTFRINGSVVSCSSPLININNSNLFFEVRGWVSVA